MKRLISICIFFIMLIFVIAACTSEPPPPDDRAYGGNSSQDNLTEGDDSDTGSMGRLLSSDYADLMNSGKYFLQYKATINAGNMQGQATVIFAMDGDNSSSIMEFNGMRTRTITINKKNYIFDDDSKTYFINTVYDGTDEPMTLTENIKYLGSGQETINGKDLVYEEYNSDGGKIKYYFDGDKLFGISSMHNDASIFMEIIELSNKVTDDMFKIPSDYKLAY